MSPKKEHGKNKSRKCTGGATQRTEGTSRYRQTCPIFNHAMHGHEDCVTKTQLFNVHVASNARVFACRTDFVPSRRSRSRSVQLLPSQVRPQSRCLRLATLLVTLPDSRRYSDPSRGKTQSHGRHREYQDIITLPLGSSAGLL